VEITVEAEELPSGIHGFHIHETGKCQSPDFQSAGGHFNPEGKKHGRNHPEGEHAGDLQNIVVDSAGKVKNTQVVKQVTLKKDETNSLLKETGTALVIHEFADDYRSDPAGKSGKRIACGVIEEK
jgi:Cu-Zn family superoxide dismutase